MLHLLDLLDNLDNLYIYLVIKLLSSYKITNYKKLLKKSLDFLKKLIPTPHKKRFKIGQKPPLDFFPKSPFDKKIHFD